MRRAQRVRGRKFCWLSILSSRTKHVTFLLRQKQKSSFRSWRFLFFHIPLITFEHAHCERHLIFICLSYLCRATLIASSLSLQLLFAPNYLIKSFCFVIASIFIVIDSQPLCASTLPKTWIENEHLNYFWAKSTMTEPVRHYFVHIKIQSTSILHQSQSKSALWFERNAMTNFHAKRRVCQCGIHVCFSV